MEHIGAKKGTEYLDSDWQKFSNAIPCIEIYRKFIQK